LLQLLASYPWRGRGTPQHTKAQGQAAALENKSLAPRAWPCAGRHPPPNRSSLCRNSKADTILGRKGRALSSGVDGMAWHACRCRHAVPSSPLLALVLPFNFLSNSSISAHPGRENFRRESGKNDGALVVQWSMMHGSSDMC
jgi:hypothetical protein